MSNRKAWGLVAVMTVAVLGGSGWLFAIHQSSLPLEERWIILLPRSDWGFGKERQVARWHGLGPHGWESGVEVLAERRHLGFFSVRVK
jgi:hypothetical protein